MLKQKNINGKIQKKKQKKLEKIKLKTTRLLSNMNKICVPEKVSITKDDVLLINNQRNKSM